VNSDRLLTIEEVADVLRVDRSTVGRYIKQGLIPVITLGKGKKAAKRIKQSTLDRLINTDVMHQKEGQNGH
jgi:excisionase family DNA binding protein